MTSHSIDPEDRYRVQWVDTFGDSHCKVLYESLARKLAQRLRTLSGGVIRVNLQPVDATCSSGVRIAPVTHTTSSGVEST